MKKILVLLLFSSFVFNKTNSQDYEPIIKEGSFWDVEEATGGSCSYLYMRYRISNDTIIEGNTHKKLQLATFAMDTSNPADPCPFYLDPLHVNENDFMDIPHYLREDVDQKKVFIWTDMYSADGVFEELILYDFTLEVGDVLTSGYVIPEGTQVDLIDSDGEGRKRYHFSEQAYFYTEGIGSNVEIISFNRIIGIRDRQLFCWGNNSNQNGCVETLSLLDEKLALIKVFPNPTTDKIFLTNLENNSFKLYSMLGKEMSFECSAENQEMDLSHLENGVYFLEIIGFNNAKRIIKIIKG